ncbi:MAG: glycosyltransferase family 2 protein [Bacteroidetes bacterium]|nr:glycosyltransferase family 2 protein [Bacteroidota bacterium]
MTREFLNSVLCQSYTNYEIIVVDNGSNDDSSQRLEELFQDVSWIRNEKNTGFSRACNQGIRLSLMHGADFVLIVNNDTLIDPNLLSTFINTSANLKSPGVLTCNILNGSGDKVWYSNGYLDKQLLEPRNRMLKDKSGEFLVEVTFISACCMFIPKAVLRIVGGFDEKFFLYYEDVDICLRMVEKSIKLFCLNKNMVLHHISSTTKTSQKKRIVNFKPEAYYGRVKGRIILLKKYSAKGFNFVASLYTASKIIKYLLGFLVLMRFKAFLAVCNGIKEGFSYKANDNMDALTKIIDQKL